MSEAQLGEAAEVSSSAVIPATNVRPTNVGAATTPFALVGQREPGQNGPNADALRQYRISLATAARRFKRYPALARERGWEGSPEVSISFRANSSAPHVELGRSSGKAVLDDQAVDMIRQAALATPLPGKLSGQDFEMRVPVKFSLEDD